MFTKFRTRFLAAAAMAAALAAAGTVAIGKDTARTPEKRAEAEMEAKIERAEAAYKLAKKKCGDARKEDGARKDARKACVHKARTDRDAAIRLAKIEKVREVAELREKEEERRTGKVTPEPSAAAKYAAAKARCEMMGPERDRCMAETKQRFNKT